MRKYTCESETLQCKIRSNNSGNNDHVNISKNIYSIAAIGDNLPKEMQWNRPGIRQGKTHMLTNLSR